MFRKMRRIRQELTKEESIEILEKQTNGILSVMGDDGFPYGVPLSYVYDNDKIYFHCAKSGHKLDSIKNNDKVCFTVVGMDEVMPSKMTSCYQSVIVFGKATIIEDSNEKLRSHMLLADKYSSQFPEQIQEEIEKSIDQMDMVQIEIVHMTGKQGLQLLKRKETETVIYKGINENAKEIRSKVFEKEQGFTDEFDEIDRKATHIVVYDTTKEEKIPIGTCRIFKKENDELEYIIGRIAVIKEARENKIGSKMVSEAEKYVMKNGGKRMSLHAQCRVKEFYKKLGYEEYGSVEDDQGCPHIWMRKDLK
jgi:hypothetical protein